MSTSAGSGTVSPWRRVFDRVREAVGSRRDEHGVVGSINWLRHRMEARGANPNVVRNIIYRDKGKPADKRVLFEILSELWSSAGRGPLRVPEIEDPLSTRAATEHEMLQVLGRDKRRAFRTFVDAVRAGEHPKLLVTGRPGSGKTVLVDCVQQALQASDAPSSLVRSELGDGDLGAGLTRLGEALGVPRAAMEARLAKIGSSGAYAVQADAQADLARAVLDAARPVAGERVLLLHVSRALAAQATLGSVPLRLNTREVPRVSAQEWLWVTLLEPLARMADVSVLVSLADLPARALQGTAGFLGPLKLTPPSAAEARRFVRARLPQLPAGQQEEVVRRAGRSFEELRTLTLLAEVRAQLPRGDATASVARLSELVTHGGDVRLRGFLSALAVVSLPEFPTFEPAAIDALRPDRREGGLSELERAFVDPVPGTSDGLRCFSRTLVRALRERLTEHDRGGYRALHLAAAERLHAEAEGAPGSEAAVRRTHHLYEARDWRGLVAWMRRHGVRQSLISAVWRAARDELAEADPERFEAVAEQVAAHYVRLGSHRHPDAVHACSLLIASSDPRRRAWATLKQAEASILQGRHDDAEARVEGWQGGHGPLLEVEAALVRASVARWRGDLARAAEIVEREARPQAATLSCEGAAERLAHAKVALWAGLLHKDAGDLEAAVREFDAAEPEDDLIRARLAFKAADALMGLGRFGAAGRTFDAAVTLSRRSGALVSERARYLARRATLHRRCGALDAAEADLDAADAILLEAEGEPVERGFWSARVDDGRALLLLARGRHDEAIELLADTVERHRAYGDARGIDSAFRIDRAVLRLGVAYAARALGAAWSLPLPHRPPAPFDRSDLAQARRLLARVIRRRTGAADGPPRLDPLARRALLASSLIEPPHDALARAERALAASRFPYPRAEARTHLAAVRLRAGDVGGCQRQLDTAQGELRAVGDEVDDPGLRAWISALRLRAHVSADAPCAAMREVERLLAEPMPEPMRREALRAFGEALEVEDRTGWLTHPALPAVLAGAMEDDVLRPGDLLVRRLGTRDQAAIERLGTVA